MQVLVVFNYNLIRGNLDSRSFKSYVYYVISDWSVPLTALFLSYSLTGGARDVALRNQMFAFGPTRTLLLLDNRYFILHPYHNINFSLLTFELAEKILSYLCAGVRS